MKLFTESKYKKIVDAVYGENGPITHNIQSLQQYALMTPGKLPKIGKYVLRKAKEGFLNRKKATCNIETSMTIFNELIKTCHGDLALFAAPVCEMMTTLLSSNNVELQAIGTDTFVRFAEHGGIQYETEKYIKYFIAMSNYQNNNEEDTKKMRVYGLRGLNAYITTTEDLDELIVRSVDTLLPIFLDNMQFKEENEADDNKSETNEEEESGVAVVEWKKVSIKKLATQCLKDMAGRVNHITVRPLCETMLQYMDSHNLWDPNAFAIRAFRSLSIGVQPQLYNTIIRFLLEHLDNKSPDQAAIKTNIVTCIEEIMPPTITQPMAEVFSYMIRQLSGLEKSNNPEQLEQAVIKTISNITKNMNDPFQRLEALTDFLTRLNHSEYQNDSRGKLGLSKCIVSVSEHIQSIAANKFYPPSLVERLCQCCVEPDIHVRLNIQTTMLHLLKQSDLLSRIHKQQSLNNANLKNNGGNSSVSLFNPLSNSLQQIHIALRSHSEMANNVPENYLLLFEAYSVLLEQLQLDELLYLIPALLHQQQEFSQSQTDEEDAPENTENSEKPDSSEKTSSKKKKKSRESSKKRGKKNVDDKKEKDIGVMNAVHTLIAALFLKMSKLVESSTFSEYVLSIIEQRQQQQQIHPAFIVVVNDEKTEYLKKNPDFKCADPQHPLLPAGNVVDVLFEKNDVIKLLQQVQRLTNSYKNLNDLLDRDIATSLFSPTIEHVQKRRNRPHVPYRLSGTFFLNDNTKSQQMENPQTWSALAFRNIFIEDRESEPPSTTNFGFVPYDSMVQTLTRWNDSVTTTLKEALDVLQLEIDESDDFSVLNLSFPSFVSPAALAATDQSNGRIIRNFAWEVINKRAKPITDNTTDPEWRCRSFSGFLGEHETFHDVVSNDLPAIQQLFGSKEQFAQTIRQIMNAADAVVGERRNIPLPFTFNDQSLIVSKNWFVSPQFSLFYNKSENSFASGNIFNDEWNCEYYIENTRNGLFVTIGGDQNHGVIHYIEQLGFCEGGHPRNEYRVDPYVVSSIFTGVITDNTRKVWKDHLQETEASFESDIRKLQKEITLAKQRATESDSSQEQLSKEVELLEAYLLVQNTNYNNLQNSNREKLDRIN